jgi:tRNA (guanine37-N1)-methyltransferase
VSGLDAPALRVDIVSIFPEYFTPLDLSLIGRARAAGRLDVAVHDLRTWTSDVHRTVDDTPYGGGAGMVMRPEPWGLALDEVASGTARLVVPTPAGVPFTQAAAHELAGEPHLVFACGRYEGIDQRVLDHAATRMPVTEVSLGDYVLFGGEVAVLVILEAVVRLLPGVLGNADSLVEESHVDGLLEAPLTTYPRSCAPATMAGSPAGAASRRCCARPHAAPTCWPHCRRPRWTKKTLRCSPGPDFRYRAPIWQSSEVAGGARPPACEPDPTRAPACGAP